MPRSRRSTLLAIVVCVCAWAGVAWAMRRASGGEMMFANRLVEIGGHPICATATDINDDGVTDLIVSSEFEHEWLVVLLGRGDGVLAPAQRIDMGRRVEAVLAADFDADGRDDLLAVQDGRVSVLLAGEDGAFSGPSGGQLASAGDNPRSTETLIEGSVL